MSLDSYATEAAISLGVKLKGTTKRLSPHLRLDNIVDIGWPPNLEKVLALKPDLLIGELRDLQSDYSLWSHVAPTVVYHQKSLTEWKLPFMLVAEALGQTEKALQVVAQYNARVAEFKARMGERLKQTRISVVNFHPGVIMVRPKSAFSGAILEELGLDRPRLQKLNPTAVTKLSGIPGMYMISPELMTLIDADVLFVLNPGFPTPVDSKLVLKQLMAEPLWSKLKVVQEGKVYVVGHYWYFGSYLSALLVLDDLFKYLVEEQ